MSVFWRALFLCCWYGWWCSQSEQSNILVSCSVTMLFPQDRVSLSLELNGNQQKHLLSLLPIVLSIETL